MIAIANVFRSLFKRKPVRLFLGELLLVPASQLEGISGVWESFKRSELDEAVQASLRDIYRFPTVSDAADVTSRDMALDVLVPKYQSGAFAPVNLGAVSFALFWRPKVTILCRLYHLKSGKTKHEFSVSEKMSMLDYFNRVTTLRGLFGRKPQFDNEDIDALLSKASHKLLLKVKKKL